MLRRAPRLDAARGTEEGVCDAPITCEKLSDKNINTVTPWLLKMFNLFAGSSHSTLNHFQRVQDAAACLLCGVVGLHLLYMHKILQFFQLWANIIHLWKRTICISTLNLIIHKFLLVHAYSSCCSFECSFWGYFEKCILSVCLSMSLHGPLLFIFSYSDCDFCNFPFIAEYCKCLLYPDFVGVGLAVTLW